MNINLFLNKKLVAYQNSKKLQTVKLQNKNVDMYV